VLRLGLADARVGRLNGVDVLEDGKLLFQGREEIVGKLCICIGRVVGFQVLHPDKQHISADLEQVIVLEELQPVVVGRLDQAACQLVKLQRNLPRLHALLNQLDTDLATVLTMASGENDHVV
jgi:hypothetical protein